MDYPSVCTLITEDSAAQTLPLAVDCTRAFGSRLDVVCVAINPLDVNAAMPLMGGGVSVASDNEALAELARTESLAKARVSREDFAFRCQTILLQDGDARRAVAGACRFSDLAMLVRADRKAAEADTLFDATLFGTALPVLLLKPDQAMTFDRIVIAWDDSAQALLAVRAALPLLKRAKQVTILMIDPESTGSILGPGEELALMLSHHGVHAQIELEPLVERRVADAIAQGAMDRQADLVVMGAYGHSRTREALLGGASRDLIRNPKLSLFLAR